MVASLMSLYPWGIFAKDSCRWNTLVFTFGKFNTMWLKPHPSFMLLQWEQITSIYKPIFWVCFLYMYRHMCILCIYICICKHTCTYLHMWKINEQRSKIALKRVYRRRELKMLLSARISDMKSRSVYWQKCFLFSENW